MIERISFKPLDKFLHNLHTNRSGYNKLLTIGSCLIVYFLIIFVFGNYLKVSSNYFIILPLIAFAFSFGLPGGVVAGIAALPVNLLMFNIIGHPEYSPDSKLIAEFSGLIIGAVLGYLSDYYFDIENEIEKRRQAEELLNQSLAEKEVLIQEIHHRVKNNLNLVKSLIQLQINRSDNEVFRKESEKLINRIFAISRVHEQLYRGNKVIEPSLREYLPPLIEDVVAGLNSSNIAVSYDINIPDIHLSIEQAASLGLILNEVLTNAIKYSFPLVENPELIVRLYTSADKTIIELQNNAPTYIPEENENSGLGLKLIKTLCLQINSEYQWVPGNGTTFRLILPV